MVATTPRLHALGTGHSFSPVADSPGALVSVAKLPRKIEIDSTMQTVSVSGGLRWGELAPVLHEAGFALHNLGSLPHISLAGSVATGTHGSGSRNGSLATAVTAFDLVTADGTVRRLARGEPDFDGAVVALGALGVVSELTLAIQPTFLMRQVVYEGLSFDSALENLDAVLDCAYSVSLFSTWQGFGFEQVWTKQRVGDAVDLRATGAAVARGQRNPVPGVSPTHCTAQGGKPGPWFERLPHFRLEFTPSSGAELQSEYFVPRERAHAALEAINSIRQQIAPVLLIGEIRTVAADNLWLSPSFGRDSLAIHFTWKPDAAAVRPVVRAVEEALAPFDPRPHWGKVFYQEAIGCYERMPDFRRLAAELDPGGKFRNTALDRHIFGVPSR